MLYDPEFEPMLLKMFFVFLILSNEGLKANRTSESLLLIGGLTEALNRARAAERTVLFFS
jgi:hypothetical protein